MKTIFAAILCFVTLQGAQASVIYLVDSGNQLTGIDGIQVGDAVYNVRFETQLDDAPEFLSAVQAETAANALLQAVLAAPGDYINNPENIFGCEYNAYSRECIMYTLFDAGDGLRRFGSYVNQSVGVAGVYEVSGGHYGYETQPRWVGANWINTSVVPIPGAVWLFGSALAGLGWLKRKR